MLDVAKFYFDARGGESGSYNLTLHYLVDKPLFLPILQVSVGVATSNKRKVARCRVGGTTFLYTPEPNPHF